MRKWLILRFVAGIFYSFFHVDIYLCFSASNIVSLASFKHLHSPHLCEISEIFVDCSISSIVLVCVRGDNLFFGEIPWFNFSGYYWRLCDGVLFVDFHHKAHRSPFKFISCESWQQTAIHTVRRPRRRRWFEKLGEPNANRKHSCKI